MGKKKNSNSHRHSGQKSLHRVLAENSAELEHARREELDEERIQTDECEEEGEDLDEKCDETIINRELSVQICLWEFGQNEPKRDSGSKMVRFGFAKKLKIGQSFQGIVLSSEATQYLSPGDRSLVESFGIAGINCSWNRLEEIPFHAMGKSQHQRKLPLLYAANAVNYGKAFKMNTAEAIAAGLYITGFVSDAVTLLYPFSFGHEFIKLNSVALDGFRRCMNAQQVQELMAHFLSEVASNQEYKSAKKAENLLRSETGRYLDESDLPPLVDSEEEDNDDDNDEEDESERVDKLKS